LSLAVVRDLREARVPAGPDELLAFETDVLAGFVLARAAAGLSDNTIRSDVLHLEQLRAWFGGPLWDMEPADADAYFGKVLRDAAKGTRLARSQALKTYFLFVEIIAWSGLSPALHSRDLSVTRAAEILDLAGLLDDDRVSSFACLTRARLALLPPPIAADVGHWLRTRSEGGPRSRPRDEDTVHR